MKVSVVDIATDTVANVIKVDPDNMPEAPDGFRYEQSGNRGQVLVDGEWATPAPIITAAQVNQERDMRLRGSFTFGGKVYQSLQDDMIRIAGAGSLAGFAMGAGNGAANNLRWANAENDFGWIAMDNTVTPMDAPTTFAFAQAAAAHESACIFAGKALKDMAPIPVDYADDKWWPQ